MAVAILGVALTTLIGLQTRLMGTLLQERNIFRATLAAQYLVTFYEIENEPPEPGTTDGSLVEALRDRGYFDGETLEGLEEQFRDWTLTQEVTSVDYAEFEDILRRIELRVRWGEGSAEQHSVVLFLNTNKIQQLQSLAGGRQP